MSRARHVVREAAADERPAVAAFLAAARAGWWPPGRTFVSHGAERLAAVARLADPPPGDGYHREHVRTLFVAGDGRHVVEIAAWTVRHAGTGLRIEAEVARGDENLAFAMDTAGLRLEAKLRRPAGERLLMGRPLPAPTRSVEPVESAGAVAATDARLPAATLRVHGPDTRAALAAFLDRLVPGRSYPAGTLLSEAEATETRRVGDLDARWILALQPDGRVVGGVVLEPVRGEAGARTARVHVDVARPWRGQGLATRLLSEARRASVAWGFDVLEADPRAGNKGACRALERAGFEVTGVQVGAWRMRTPSRRWDEDVVRYAVPAQP